jgi:type IV pilus assembly protein PilX
MGERIVRKYKRDQKGVTLFIVLILIVAMTIGGMALFRSVETTNQVSGNLSFKVASIHVGDVGMESAIAEIPAIVASSSDANFPSGCTQGAAYPNACRYYALAQPVDDSGVPTGIIWDNVRAQEPITGYKVRYVVERMCEGSLPITDVSSKCKTLAPTNGGTKKAGEVVFTGAQQIYYRVTVKVDGPRSTRSFTRLVFSR